MKLTEARSDFYRRKAREEGYKSRAAYKLLEAVRKYKLFVEGSRVVDIGAAPGGWLQVTSEIVGESGLVVGVDLDEIRLDLPNVRTIKMDINDAAAGERITALLKGNADSLLSDLSPKISGAWDLDHYKQVDLVIRSLELSDTLMNRGGSAMLKIFDGERFVEARKEAERRFATVTVMKPKASRSSSSEVYLICLGRRT